MTPSLRAGLVAAALAAVAFPGAALAAHGKPGLWQITIKSNLAGMISPAQAARMKAMGVTVPMGSTMSIQHCMTAQEVAMDKPPPMSRGKECTVANLKISGQSMSSDTVCTGNMQGRGHAEVVFDTPGHYKGKMSFSGTAHGHTANMTMEMEGRWLTASCGKVTH